MQREGKTVVAGECLPKRGRGLGHVQGQRAQTVAVLGLVDFDGGAVLIE